MLLEEGPSSSQFKPNQANTMRYHMQRGHDCRPGQRPVVHCSRSRRRRGTLINSALSFQPSDDVLDEWGRVLDDPYWSSASLGPIYDEVAADIGVADTQPWFAGANNRLIDRGIKALGLDGGLAPRRPPRCVGCGICNYGCPTSGRRA